MGSLHFMAFFFISIFHFAFAKQGYRSAAACGFSYFTFLNLLFGNEFNFNILQDFLEQTDATNSDVIKFLRSKIKDATPNGTKNEEQTELVQIKEIKRQVINGLMYTFDFEARGLKSNSLYVCKMVLSKQEGMGIEEIKEYNCNVGHARLISDEELSSDIENSFNPIFMKMGPVGDKAKKYAKCMAKAAIRCAVE